MQWVQLLVFLLFFTLKYNHWTFIFFQSCRWSISLWKNTLCSEYLWNALNWSWMGFDQREFTTRYFFRIFCQRISYQSRSNQIKLCNREVIITAGACIVDILGWETKTVLIKLCSFLEISSENLHKLFPSCESKLKTSLVLKFTWNALEFLNWKHTW